MDNIFAQEREVELPAYLEALMHYFGNSYICLWSYHPSHPSNSLVFLAGFYKQHHHASSSELVARRHFNDYTQSTFRPLNDRVPGHAFTQSQPCVELNEAQLMRMASILPQRLFYKEAMIKTAVFMGCRSGEIELGWSNLRAEQMKIEDEMMKLFPEDFSRRHVMMTSDDLVGSSSNHRPSSSTSSLRSTSPLDNTTTSPPPPEYSSFLINLTSPTTSSTTSHQPHLPTAVASEVVDAAITRALLAVFTSLPQYTTTTTTPPNTSSGTSSAFSNYFSTSGSLSSSRRLLIGVKNRPSMFKRALTYYRTRRRQQQEEQQQQQQQQHMPSTTQLHHMISERRRREKINHSFQSLRSLLPPHPKKDKATVLSRTQEYLKSLITQVAQLSERTQQLESKLVQLNQPLGDAAGAAINIREPESKAADINHTTTYERVVDVRLRAVEEMTSDHQEQYTVELQVTLLRDHCSVSDIVIRVLEFLRRLRHVNLIAMEANTTTTSHVAPMADSEQALHLSRANFTLQIEGDEWDEAAFQEAVRRVVADLTQ
ncbi:Putative transcription factor bHLH041 [Linum grandiflorum]